jgi:molecular chaperone GrpE
MTKKTKTPIDNDLETNQDEWSDEDIDAADDAIGAEPERSEAEKKTDELRDQLQRAQARLVNVERNSEKRIADAHKYAINRFVQEILPVKDSLEQTLDAGGSEKHKDFLALHEGVEMTLNMLSNTLSKFGVTTIDPLNKPFDPTYHEAMTVQPSTEKPNTVLSVVQKGYCLHDRVVRPARVVVSKAIDDSE